MFSSSLLNFLSGLFAGAGLNLITQAQTGPLTQPKWAVFADSVPWVAASIFTAWAGHIVSQSERESELKIREGLTDVERRAIVLAEQRKVQAKYRLLMVAAIFGFAMALLLTPGFLVEG
ncbi:MAG: hypothetical protein ACJ786_17580 [Catenulispora sp.]